jgi:hypothetical protein
MCLKGLKCFGFKPFKLYKHFRPFKHFFKTFA